MSKRALGSQMEELIDTMGGDAPTHPVPSKYATAEQMERLIEAAKAGGGGEGGGSSVSPYNSTPASLGEGSAGSSDKFARGDHVHPKPSASDLGAVASDQGVANAGKFMMVGDDGVVVPATLPLYNGGVT